MIVSLIVQAQLIARTHLQVGTVIFATVLAMAAGAVGAKAWNLVKHRHEHTTSGWCIQGFILGATLAALIAFEVARLPLGTVLDASAPGLLLGMAIGRIGCFLAGCCGGPPTASRWGIWCSDQRIGARRVPSQLMESLFCLLVGIGALTLFLARGPAGGALFVATLAAYTLFREGVLRLRAEQMKTWLPAPVMPVLSSLILVVALVVLVRT
jgi:phosphatidylglycerol:prolipoprotein diacylglycerol transferase